MFATVLLFHEESAAKLLRSPRAVPTSLVKHGTSVVGGLDLKEENTLEICQCEPVQISKS